MTLLKGVCRENFGIHFSKRAALNWLEQLLYCNENSYRYYGAPGQPSINNSCNSCIYIIVKLIGYGRK